MRKSLACRRCSNELDLGPYFEGCPRCAGALEVQYDYASVEASSKIGRAHV